MGIHALERRLRSLLKKEKFRAIIQSQAGRICIATNAAPEDFVLSALSTPSKERTLKLLEKVVEAAEREEWPLVRRMVRFAVVSHLRREVPLVRVLEDPDHPDEFAKGTSVQLARYVVTEETRTTLLSLESAGATDGFARVALLEVVTLLAEHAHVYPRDVVLLFAVADGHQPAEIARALGISREACRQRLFAARRRLAQFLRARGYDSHPRGAPSP